MIAEIKKGFNLAARCLFFLLRHPYLLIYMAISRVAVEAFPLAMPSYKMYPYYSSMGAFIAAAITTYMGIILVHHSDRILQLQQKSLLAILNERKLVIASWIIVSGLLKIVARILLNIPWIGMFILHPLTFVAFTLITFFIITLITYEHDSFFVEMRRSLELIQLFWKELLGGYIFLAGIVTCILAIGALIIISLFVPSIVAHLPLQGSHLTPYIKTGGTASGGIVETIIYSVLILLCASLYKEEQHQELEEIKVDARSTWMD